MRDRNITWVQKVNEIKKLCAEAKLPIDVLKDSNPHGIDAQLDLSDIEFIKTGDVFEANFFIILRFSINKDKWAELLTRIMLLSEKMSDNVVHTFDGWKRIDSDSDLIYEGTVIIKGLMNPQLLS